MAVYYEEFNIGNDLKPSRFEQWANHAFYINHYKLRVFNKILIYAL